MSDMRFEVKISAVAEVHDAEGNLISSEPVMFRHEVPEAHLRALGYTDEQITEIKEQNR